MIRIRTLVEDGSIGITSSETRAILRLTSQRYVSGPFAYA